MKLKKQLNYREHELDGAIWAINELIFNPHLYGHPDKMALEQWKMNLEERRKEVKYLLAK
jgi:hypothetical protein